MNHQVRIRNHGTVAVVDVEGRFTLGEGTAALRQAIENLVSAGRTEVVVNLRDAVHLDSSAIGELLAANSAVSTYGGIVRLAGLNRRVHDIFSVARLFMVFDVFDDEQLAVTSFARPRTNIDASRTELYFG